MSKSRSPQKSDGRDERGSYTVDAWCKHRGLSRSMFYKLKEQGKAPRTYYVGARPFVTDEADAAWLRDREAEGGTTTSVPIPAKTERTAA